MNTLIEKLQEIVEAQKASIGKIEARLRVSEELIKRTDLLIEKLKRETYNT